MINKLLTAALALLLLPCCSSTPKNGLKVAATAVPHAQMLDYIKPDLKAQGIDLIVIVTDDYNMPNRALANKEIDANFFQHQPFLDEQIVEFHYPIESIAKVELEPMGIYSKSIKSLADLKDGATIAIPNDPTNEGRALLLLQSQGVIQVGTGVGLQATPINIVENPKNIKFIEVDAAMLPRSLQDVDAAAINTNYALQAGLSPETDALALESKDSPYVNVLVVRIGDESRPDIVALKTAMTSEKMKQFIINTYKGAVLPAF
ncbi:MAG: MetQ/NlpA family ABC transporter substrate-binding protein [Parachlamydiales bacterium]|nr:MetQ/NlpA family ABC transporter substrate-binding protein [Candidatus Acheromyda pituitae]